eukprot:TRINITY_DN5124_c0_g1_i1.p1 TRINITY_DN5124_c0_g1~~TRINITY_DN5124_c0_g1_i1.p1  ORF type:complete len:140 (+),score=28.67 TRINITY_DN5124_c0_g1_i1:29-448(+)
MALRCSGQLPIRALDGQHCSLLSFGCRWNRGVNVRTGNVKPFLGSSLTLIERDVRRTAKFQEFGGSKDSSDEVAVDVGGGQIGAENVENYVDTRDDSVLPGDMEDAVVQSAQSSAFYIASGGTRAIVGGAPAAGTGESQ